MESCHILAVAGIVGDPSSGIVMSVPETVERISVLTGFATSTILSASLTLFRSLTLSGVNVNTIGAFPGESARNLSDATIAFPEKKEMSSPKDASPDRPAIPRLLSTTFPTYSSNISPLMISISSSLFFGNDTDVSMAAVRAPSVSRTISTVNSVPMVTVREFGSREKVA